MMTRSALYVARVSADDPSDLEVLHCNDIAYGFFEVAAELWRLSGDLARAEAFDAVVASAFELEPPQLDKSRIESLKGLLEGLDHAAYDALTDGDHLLSRERIEELRGITQTLELDESDGSDARYAIQVALVYVDNLRGILDEALSNEASILFD